MSTNAEMVEVEDSASKSWEEVYRKLLFGILFLLGLFLLDLLMALFPRDVADSIGTFLAAAALAGFVAAMIAASAAPLRFLQLLSISLALAVTACDLWFGSSGARWAFYAAFELLR